MMFPLDKISLWHTSVPFMQKIILLFIAKNYLLFIIFIIFIFQREKRQHDNVNMRGN